MGQASRSIRNSGANDEPAPLWTADDPMVTPHRLDGVAPSLGLGMKQEDAVAKRNGRDFGAERLGEVGCLQRQFWRPKWLIHYLRRSCGILRKAEQRT
jgi:hypothetical protein